MFRLNKKNLTVIMFFIIAVQLFRIIYSFSFLKAETHSDEEWSYGLANSYYEPYIYQTADETGYTHMNEWLSADIFRDYLTVDKEHRFSYDSVFYNQSKDLHPPLYYLILHTICSFFPGKFSFWYGFAINIIVFLVTQIFLFKLMMSITDSSLAAVSCIILYGFSIGALNTFIFVRMYAMLTMFGVIYTYFHSELYRTKNFKRNMAFIFPITVLGALTHHYFLAFAGLVSACYCFYYLFTKQIKRMFMYAVLMLLSVGTSILIFPATINHLFFRRGNVLKFDPYWQFKSCLDYSFSELFSIHFSVLRSALPKIIPVLLIGSVVIVSPLIFLFRKEKWFKKFVLVFTKKSKEIFQKIKNKFKNPDFLLVVLFISSFGMIFVTSRTISAKMADYTDRYMFVVYPYLCALAVMIFSYFFRIVLKKRVMIHIALISLTIISVAVNNITQDSIYFFRNVKNDIDIVEMTEGKDIIFITDENWLMTSLAKYIYNADDVYISGSRKTMIESIVCPEDEDLLYLMIDERCFRSEEGEEVTNMFELNNDLIRYNSELTREEIIDIFNSKDNVNEIESNTDLYIVGRKFEVYIIK